MVRQTSEAGDKGGMAHPQFRAPMEFVKPGSFSLNSTVQTASCVWGGVDPLWSEHVIGKPCTSESEGKPGWGEKEGQNGSEESCGIHTTSILQLLPVSQSILLKNKSSQAGLPGSGWGGGG